MSPSAPELEEISILSHDEKLSNPKKFSTQDSRIFRWFRLDFEPIDRFQRIFRKFLSTQGVLWNLSTSPGTRQERVGLEKPAIDLYDLSKKIQYHLTRQEFDIANDLLKDLPSDRSQELKKMFELD